MFRITEKMYKNTAVRPPPTHLAHVKKLLRWLQLRGSFRTVIHFAR